MRRSLKTVLARLNQIVARIEAEGSAVDIATILINGRRRAAERKRRYDERGYGETAAERYARHLEEKPKLSAEDIERAPSDLRWGFRRWLTVWTRLEPEYAAEATREAAGYPRSQDPDWWLKSDEELHLNANGSIEQSIVAHALARMRQERIERITSSQRGER
jgi:hypothetical protein